MSRKLVPGAPVARMGNLREIIGYGVVTTFRTRAGERNRDSAVPRCEAPGWPVGAAGLALAGPGQQRAGWLRRRAGRIPPWNSEVPRRVGPDRDGGRGGA